MIIAGAGGHALEIFDLINAESDIQNLVFFEEFNTNGRLFHKRYLIINDDKSLQDHFKLDKRFLLGVGNPNLRSKFYNLMTSKGGIVSAVIGQHTVISPFTSIGDGTDILHYCFVGANTKIGRGCLINTGAQVHHEVKIGDFTVINPSAVILGNVEIGDFCSIGANATILPGIKLGKHVVVGAGAVVTRDVKDGLTTLGVPSKNRVNAK